MSARPAIGKHLATFNLFREADNSIHVTVAEARGVREELGDSGAPLYLCTINALRRAEELHIPAGWPCIESTIIAEIERVAPLSGSTFSYDAETGSLDFEGSFRPREMAEAIANAMLGRTAE